MKIFDWYDWDWVHILQWRNYLPSFCHRYQPYGGTARVKDNDSLILWWWAMTTAPALVSPCCSREGVMVEVFPKMPITPAGCPLTILLGAEVKPPYSSCEPGCLVPRSVQLLGTPVFFFAVPTWLSLVHASSKAVLSSRIFCDGGKYFECGWCS